VIKFEKIQPGTVLFDIHLQTMGNTRSRRLGQWDVRVISVNRESRTAVVSWNGNKPETWGARQLSKLYSKPTKAYLAQRSRP